MQQFLVAFIHCLLMLSVSVGTFANVQFSQLCEHGEYATFVTYFEYLDDRSMNNTSVVFNICLLMVIYSITVQLSELREFRDKFKFLVYKFSFF